MLARRGPVLLVLGFLIVATNVNLQAIAYDSYVYDNLARSRQALLDQKQKLQETADRIGQQLDNLNHQMDTVNAYLRDTDSAIHDVEDTMAKTQ